MGVPDEVSSAMLRQRKTMRTEDPNETGSTSPSSVASSATSNSNNSNNGKKDTNNSSSSSISKKLPSSVRNLFTSKEERHFFHIHKLLGFSVLISFAYRLSCMGKYDGNFGASPRYANYGTLVFVAHHWILNASSFLFDIPQRRIGVQRGGYRIYPEYRLHSLVFATRSLAFILLIWFEQRQGIQIPNSRHRYYFMDLLLVLLTSAMADLASYSQGKEFQSPTVRGATFADPLEQHFASEMQLAVTAFCIVGYRRYSIHLLNLFNIQVNAFLMTLQRKNVAPHFVLMSCYTLMLLFSAVAITMDDNYSRRTAPAIAFGGIATVLRMGPLNCNKYVLWTVLFAMWHYIRLNRIVSIYNNWTWLNLFCILRLVCFGMALYKRHQKKDVPKSSVILGLACVIHVFLYGFLWYVNRDFTWRLLA